MQTTAAEMATTAPTEISMPLVAMTKVMLPKQEYKLNKVVQVFGRQGVCTDGEYYWVSGSKTLTKYDKNWKEVARNTTPFEGYKIPANHIGDIDVYNNEIYVGAENFVDGVGKDIQIAVHAGSPAPPALRRD